MKVKHIIDAVNNKNKIYLLSSETLKDSSLAYDTRYQLEVADDKWGALLNHGEKNGMVIISACREEYNDGDRSNIYGQSLANENLKRSRELEKDIRGLGYGYKPAVGGFVENKNGSKETNVDELSYIVVKPESENDVNFLNSMIALGNKYEQDSILVLSQHINEGNPVWVNTKSTKDVKELFLSGKLSKKLEDPDYNAEVNPEDRAYYTKPIGANKTGGGKVASARRTMPVEEFLENEPAEFTEEKEVEFTDSKQFWFTDSMSTIDAIKKYYTPAKFNPTTIGHFKTDADWRYNGTLYVKK